MKARLVKNNDGTVWGVSFLCPGCRDLHAVPTNGPHGWTFNGDLERPTLSPSVLLRDNLGPEAACHFHLVDGEMRFCADCRHPLAGANVPLETLEAPAAT